MSTTHFNPAIAIFEWPGIGRLRGQSILDGDTNALETLADEVETLIFHLVGAEHIAATVHHVQAGQRTLDTAWPMHADENVRFAGHEVIAALDVLAELRGGQPGPAGTDHRQGALIDRRDGKVGQDRGDFRVDRGHRPILALYSLKAHSGRPLTSITSRLSTGNGRPTTLAPLPCVALMNTAAARCMA